MDLSSQLQSVSILPEIVLSVFGIIVMLSDPFIAANAYRLNAIAWALLGLQLLSIVIGAIGKAIASRDFPLHLDAGFSINGWLCVIFTFVLARVFAEGTLMREDLEGTV